MIALTHTRTYAAASVAAVMKDDSLPLSVSGLGASTYEARKIFGYLTPPPLSAFGSDLYYTIHATSPILSAVDIISGSSFCRMDRRQALWIAISGSAQFWTCRWNQVCKHALALAQYHDFFAQTPYTTTKARWSKFCYAISMTLSRSPPTLSDRVNGDNPSSERKEQSVQGCCGWKDHHMG